MAIENTLSNQQMGSKIARNSVFDCQLSLDWRQMTIKNSVCNDFYLSLSIVLTFSIAAYQVCLHSSTSQQGRLWQVCAVCSDSPEPSLLTNVISTKILELAPLLLLQSIRSWCRFRGQSRLWQHLQPIRFKSHSHWPIRSQRQWTSPASSASTDL